MNRYAVFLRAVNVGGTGRLPMAELRRMCDEIGFTEVRTYIASGNVVLTSDESKRSVKIALENKLQAFANKPIGVVVRNASELRAVLDNNPFPGRDPKHTLAILLDRKPPKDALVEAVGQSDEEMRIGSREIYVHYKSGIGQSKLRIPAAKEGTARNMNTIAKMVELTKCN
jgi:uncharacterized protein (DUF1697 family)